MANYPYATEPLATGFPEGILTSTLNEDTAVGGLTDNHTAVNKIGVKTTIGRQIALIQNFVNSRYIGRSDLYIQDGYISGVHVNTLFGSDYDGVSDIGEITMASVLVPGDSPAPGVFASIGSDSDRFYYMYADHISTTYLEAYDTSATDSNGYIYIQGNILSGVISHQGHIRPSINEYYDLGLSNKAYRYGFINSLQVYSIHADDAGSGVLLCSNLNSSQPGSGPYDIGVPYEFRIVQAQKFFSTSPASAYNAIQPDAFWVDASGYVRHGDFPETAFLS